MWKMTLNLSGLVLFLGAILPAQALDTSQPPGGNFDLSHWYLQLPTSGGILTGTAGSVDSASTAQLVAGFTNAYFYTGPDGAMTFWVPDNGATTSGSTHPRSELREELVPGNTGVNWIPYGTHVMTATCVVSNLPSDTQKVCIGQIHENAGGGVPMAMIMFSTTSSGLYVNYWTDGNDNNSSTSWKYGNVPVGTVIHYQMSVVNGVLSVAINGTTNSFDLFNSGANWTNIANASYFKAGAYNQTTNQCNCSTDGAQVVFYSLNRYHAPSITNQPASLLVTNGNPATFSVAASGNGNLSYQWWFNVTNMLGGATNAALVITNASAANAGNYTVAVSDDTASFNSVTSSVATLIVASSGPNYTFTTPGMTAWTCPAGVTAVQVECWGGGGAGGSAFRNPNSSSVQYGGGGAGGAYARLNAYPVTPGNSYYLNVGVGGLAAIGTLTNDVTVPGGDSWFNTTNLPPLSAGGCLARGGAGGQCAVGNTTATAFGTGGTGTTNGCLGDLMFAGGSGGTLGSSTGSGGSGGGSGGIASDGISGGTNGVAAVAVTGGGPGGAPNPTSGSSGPGQAPVFGPGGGGGGARATTQQSGGNGAAGQVILTPLTVSMPTVGFVLKTNQAFELHYTGVASGSYLVLAKTNLADPVWVPIATNVTDSNGHGVFQDTNLPGSLQRFYRLGMP